MTKYPKIQRWFFPPGYSISNYDPYDEIHVGYTPIMALLKNKTKKTPDMIQICKNLKRYLWILSVLVQCVFEAIALSWVARFQQPQKPHTSPENFQVLEKGDTPLLGKQGHRGAHAFLTDGHYPLHNASSELFNVFYSKNDSDALP